MSETFKELEYHRDTMRAFESECLSESVDFSKVVFHCNDNTMWLELRDGTFPRSDLHFRINPHNTKDEDAIHAHKQLCRSIKVPYKFFSDNRPKSREAIVRDWVTALIPGAADSIYKMKVRNCREVSIIRAILPTSQSDYPNYRVIDSLITHGAENGMRLLSISGEDMDSKATELAVAFGDPVDFSGMEYEVGLILKFSDVGTDNIEVHAYIFAKDGSASFPFTFGYAPFLDLPYSAMSPQDMDKVIAGLPGALLGLRSDLTAKLVAASSVPYSGPEYALEVLSSRIKNKAVLKKMRREFLRPEAADEYQTAVDFARGVSSLARSYDGDTRMTVELAASSFLSLNLPPIDNKEEPK